MRCLIVIVTASILAACGGSSSNVAAYGDGTGPGELVCPGDPDAFIGAGETIECPDYWVCTETELEGKRCTNPGPDFPDGGGEWACEYEYGQTVCRGDEMPEGGGSEGWTCVDETTGVVCTRDQPQVPDGEGSGAWACEHGEFVICDSIVGDGGDADVDGDVDGDADGDIDGDDADDWVVDGPVEPGSDGAPDDEGSICFYPSDGAPLADEPAARAWFSMEVLDGVEVLHCIIAFSTAFVDNTYGVNSSSGYRGGHGHTFRDLVLSDHVLLGFVDRSDGLVLEAKFDYISVDASAPSGYGNLGVLGGDGAVLVGSADAVVSTMTSFDYDLNELGCVFLESSPGPGECDGWNEQVVYEMWIRADIFPGGFASMQFDSVHASPSRISQDTVMIQPGDCPP